MAASETDQNPSGHASFESEAAVVLQEMRPALAAILERLSPAVTRPTDVHRLLSLDHKLSWSIFNAANAEDARALASLLPGKRAMERFFAAAAQHGVDDGTIDRARMSFKRFEQSVARHAGTRDMFETMVAQIGNDRDASGEGAASAADAKHKRAMFRAASLLWGRQARTCFGCIIVHPSARPGLLDRVLVKGMIGLQQTRRGTPLYTIARHWYKATKGDPSGPSIFEPLDPRESAPDSVGLLRDFCSQPPPTFRAHTGDAGKGFTSHELVATGIGAASEVSYFTGHVARAGGVMLGIVPGSEIMLTKAVELPIEVYIGDVLMHESVWDEQLPEVSVYSSPLPGSPLDFRDADLLPLSEKAAYLGRGLDCGRTPQVPGYVEMLSYALERVGWNPAEFRVFRCRVAHPALSSRIRMTFRK